MKRKLRQEDLEYYRSNNLGHSLTEVARHFQKRASQGLNREGYRAQASHQAILVHLGLNGSRLTDLAKRAGITKQAMGQLVDEVEALGYVERVPDPADRRAKLIRFTQRGCDLIKCGTKVGMAVQAEYVDILGKRKMEELRALLGELYTKLRKREGEAAGGREGRPRPALGRRPRPAGPG